jgi:hypothetical protein
MGYAQQGPPRGGGGSPFISPGVPLNPLERMAVMLLRLIGWISLILVVISACTIGIGYLMTMGDKAVVGDNGFRWLLANGGALVAEFAGRLVGPAVLFALAAIVESLVAMRNK